MATRPPPRRPPVRPWGSPPRPAGPVVGSQGPAVRPWGPSGESAGLLGCATLSFVFSGFHHGYRGRAGGRAAELCMTSSAAARSFPAAEPGAAREFSRRWSGELRRAGSPEVALPARSMGVFRRRRQIPALHTPGFLPARPPKPRKAGFEGTEWMKVGLECLSGARCSNEPGQASLPSHPRRP